MERPAAQSRGPFILRAFRLCGAGLRLLLDPLHCPQEEVSVLGRRLVEQHPETGRDVRLRELLSRPAHLAPHVDEGSARRLELDYDRTPYLRQLGGRDEHAGPRRAPE